MEQEEKQKEYKHKSILFLSHTKIIKEYELISIEPNEDDDIVITTLKNLKGLNKHIDAIIKYISDCPNRFIDILDVKANNKDLITMLHAAKDNNTIWSFYSNEYFGTFTKITHVHFPFTIVIDNKIHKIYGKLWFRIGFPFIVDYIYFIYGFDCNGIHWSSCVLNKININD